MPPVEESDCCLTDRVTVTREKILILVNLYCGPSGPLLSYFNTSPCAIQSTHVKLCDYNKTVINSLKAFENITSLWCDVTSSKSVVEFAEFVAAFQKRFTILDEVLLIDHDHSNVHTSIPPVACRRMRILTYNFTSLFNCAYQPFGKLQSLHINAPNVSKSKLEFNNEISKIIVHNCNSLLELDMSGVRVARNNTLLQETFQKCHALVILSIRDGSKGSARLSDIFYSIQSLLNLKYLDVTELVDVYGEDLCALHDLLCKALPKLKYCQLSFRGLALYLTLLGDTKYESIQKLLRSLLPPSSYDEHVIRRGFKAVDDWLAGLRCDVKFDFYWEPDRRL